MGHSKIRRALLPVLAAALVAAGSTVPAPASSAGMIRLVPDGGLDGDVRAASCKTITLGSPAGGLAILTDEDTGTLAGTSMRSDFGPGPDFWPRSWAAKMELEAWVDYSTGRATMKAVARPGFRILVLSTEGQSHDYSVKITWGITGRSAAEGSDTVNAAYQAAVPDFDPLYGPPYATALSTARVDVGWRNLTRDGSGTFAYDEPSSHLTTYWRAGGAHVFGDDAKTGKQRSSIEEGYNSHTWSRLTMLNNDEYWFFSSLDATVNARTYRSSQSAAAASDFFTDHRELATLQVDVTILTPGWSFEC